MALRAQVVDGSLFQYGFDNPLHELRKVTVYVFPGNAGSDMWSFEHMRDLMRLMNLRNNFMPFHADVIVIDEEGDFD